MKTKFTILLAILALACWATAASASEVFYGGINGNRFAQADFFLAGNTLSVTLVNTADYDIDEPDEVLTGVGFNTTHTLTPVSANLGNSTVFYAPPTFNNVGEGWQYQSGINFHGKNSGISAAGLGGIFGPNGNFFTPGVQLDGVDYGILSYIDDPATGNGDITNGGPLIKYVVTFILTADPDFSLSELGDTVVLQYGTELTDPFSTGGILYAIDVPVPAVPLPPSVLLMGSGLLGLGLLGFRKKTKG